MRALETRSTIQASVPDVYFPGASPPELGFPPDTPVAGLGFPCELRVRAAFDFNVYTERFYPDDPENPESQMDIDIPATPGDPGPSG
mgnify:CR=1 FL=1